MSISRSVKDQLSSLHQLTAEQHVTILAQSERVEELEEQLARTRRSVKSLEVP